MIKGIVLGFNGVLTNNLITIDNDGKEYITFSVRDDIAIQGIRDTVSMLVLSSWRSSIIQQRCHKLHIPQYQNAVNKKKIFLNWISNNKFKFSEVVYVGSNLRDFECMDLDDVVSIAVADAVDEVKQVAWHTLETRGGMGVIEEVCNLVLNNN